MRFIHAADIHLDSPLRGLESYPDAPVQRLRIATRQAFERLVDLCIRERVDFLIIAGDLFDADVRDFHAALAAASQLRRLHQLNIPVYLILGNHDSRDETTRHVPWPDNVTVFDHKRPQSIRHPELPVVIHGMSYSKREMTDNLVPVYPLPVPGLFNIGLLHTNADGNSRHAPYAPCSVTELVAKGYDYWALGHVHNFAVLHKQPHVVYSGNTQGRHAREIGEKGCLLVGIDSNGEVHEFDFHATDVVRWCHATICLQFDDDEAALLDATRDHLRGIISKLDGRLVAVRLEFKGRCQVHTQLATISSRQQLIANIRAMAADLSSDVWIEKIKFHTQAPLDLDALRERHDLIGQLLRDIDSIAANPKSLLSLPETKDFVAKIASDLSLTQDGDDAFNMEDLERHVGWLRDAEALLLSHLVKDSGSDS